MTLVLNFFTLCCKWIQFLWDKVKSYLFYDPFCLIYSREHFWNWALGLTIRTIPGLFVSCTSRLGAEQLLGGQQPVVLLTCLSWHQMAVSEARRAVMRASIFSTCHTQSRLSISQEGVKNKKEFSTSLPHFLKLCFSNRELGTRWEMLESSFQVKALHLNSEGGILAFLSLASQSGVLPCWSRRRERKLLVQITNSHLSYWIFVDV